MRTETKFMRGFITITTLLAIAIIVSSFSFYNESPLVEATLEEDAAIQWMSFEQALELNKIEKKKLFVNIYTERCAWCTKMDKTTLSDPAIANYINENFHPVKIDAANTKEVVINDKTYKYVRSSRGGYHELVALLTNGRLSSPTFVFIDENLNVIQPIAGYKASKEFEVIMTYFGGDFHRKVPWVSYQKRYNGLPKATFIKD